MKNRTIATLKNYGVEPSSPQVITWGISNYKKKDLSWNITEPRRYLLLVFFNSLMRHSDHFVHLHKLESRRQRRAEKKELLVSSLFKSEWYFLIRENTLLLSYGT